MVATCEDDLICDMAETYHILDWRALPLRKAAVLASGLHPDSRCMMRLSGNRLRTDTLLQAAALDRLTTLVWMKTEDGQKGKNRPESVVDRLTGKAENTNKVTGFRSAEDFEKRRQEIIGGKSIGE